MGLGRNAPSTQSRSGLSLTGRRSGLGLIEGRVRLEPDRLPRPERTSYQPDAPAREFRCGPSTDSRALRAGLLTVFLAGVIQESLCCRSKIHPAGASTSVFGGLA